MGEIKELLKVISINKQTELRKNSNIYIKFLSEMLKIIQEYSVAIK